MKTFHEIKNGGNRPFFRVKCMLAQRGQNYEHVHIISLRISFSYVQISVSIQSRRVDKKIVKVEYKFVEVEYKFVEVELKFVEVEVEIRGRSRQTKSSKSNAKTFLRPV